MSNIPANLKYTEQHEWVKIDGDIATIGITDYAQTALGDLVFIELPSHNKPVKAHDAFIVVESVKAASEVYAPVAGTVVAVNEELAKSPGLVNMSPYEEGWICKLHVSDKNDLSKLLSAAEYQKLLG